MKKYSSTSTSLGSWTKQQSAPNYVRSSDTGGISTEGTVLLSGRLAHGGGEVVLSVQPRVVERKIAIRSLNDRLQGRTVETNTAVRSK
jgi:hypothetical protein